MFEYVDTHRAELNAWELVDFVTNFDADEKIFNLYLKKIDLKTPIDTEAREDLKLYFKAFFARDLFEQTGFFMVTQKTDTMILKVIELDKNKSTIYND